jgi:predicted nucleic acid-binding protein
MELVVDAAIIFSFFKPDSFTRRLVKVLYVNRVKLYSPDYLFEELLSLKDKARESAGISEQEFLAAYILLETLIEAVPKEEYALFLPQAGEMLKEHRKDIPYFALALKLNCPLWSNEKKLKDQDRIVVHSTQELKKMFNVPEK